MQIYAINTNKHPAKIWKQFVTQKSLWLPLPVPVCVRAWACRGKQTTSRKLKSKHKWHMQSEENGTVAKMNIKKRKEKKESLQMIMKMPSQSLNWPSNKWRASGWARRGKARELWCAVQKSKSPKIKSDLFAKTPKTESEWGMPFEMWNSCKDWGTVINRVACVQLGVWAAVATMRARRIPQEAEPDYLVNAPYTGLYFICTRSALLITHCLFNLSHLLLLFLVACTALC